MGAPYQRTQRTQVIPGTCNPRWNSSMQFFVRNANEDVLCLTVFDNIEQRYSLKILQIWA